MAITCGGAATDAAGPSMWAKARDPDLERRTEAIAQAEAMLIKGQRSRDTRRDPGASMRLMYWREARDILEKAGAAKSRDQTLRMRLAEVVFLLGDYAAAVPLYESLLKENLPAANRSTVVRDLAFSYGSLERREDQIRAYGEALALEPLGVARSRLLTNRAEGYMATGQLSPAVEGYRAALASLSQNEMRAGVTALWGLAVALDRSGDVEEGLQAIRLARSYDPADADIRDRTVWMFDPAHDEHWYAALGHWSAARFADLGAARAEWYARAVSSWQEYIATAPADDRWVAIAKARVRQCEKERDSAQKRFKPAKVAPPVPRAMKAPAKERPPKPKPVPSIN